MGEKRIDNPYKNSEGYSDPTAYYAIRNCTQEYGNGYMPLVMIYAAGQDSENMLARKGSCLAVRMNCIPIAPQLICMDCYYQDSKVNQVKARQIAMILLRKCKEVWICGNGDDAFVPRLIDKALSLGITLKFYSESFEEAVNV